MISKLALTLLVIGFLHWVFTRKVEPKQMDTEHCFKCGSKLWWFDNRQFYCENPSCEYHVKKSSTVN